MAPSLGMGQANFAEDPTLLVSIELPALAQSIVMSFDVKASRHTAIFEGIEDLVRDLAEGDLAQDLLSVDYECSAGKLEQLRKNALAALKDWMSKLRDAEEWKRKVDRASSQMNHMRDSYFKELIHLREQVYQQSKANEEGNESWLPTYAFHFDPVAYHMDEEVIRLVTDKIKVVQQEFEFKMNEHEVRRNSRIESLNESLVVAKMQIFRKNKLIEKLLSNHGYQDEAHVQAELGGVREANRRKISAEIEKEVARAEELASRAFCGSAQAQTILNRVSPKNLDRDCALIPLEAGGRKSSHDSAAADTLDSSSDSSDHDPVVEPLRAKAPRARAELATRRASSTVVRTTPSKATKAPQRDVGTDAMPFHIAFPSIACRTRGTQSTTHGTVVGTEDWNPYLHDEDVKQRQEPRRTKDRDTWKSAPSSRSTALPLSPTSEVSCTAAQSMSSAFVEIFGQPLIKRTECPVMVDAQAQCRARTPSSQMQLSGATQPWSMQLPCETDPFGLQLEMLEDVVTTLDHSLPMVFDRAAKLCTIGDPASDNAGAAQSLLDRLKRLLVESVNSNVCSTPEELSDQPRPSAGATASPQISSSQASSSSSGVCQVLQRHGVPVPGAEKIFDCGRHKLGVVARNKLRGFGKQKSRGMTDLYRSLSPVGDHEAPDAVVCVRPTSSMSSKPSMFEEAGNVLASGVRQLLRNDEDGDGSPCETAHSNYVVHSFRETASTRTSCGSVSWRQESSSSSFCATARLSYESEVEEADMRVSSLGSVSDMLVQYPESAELLSELSRCAQRISHDTIRRPCRLNPICTKDTEPGELHVAEQPNGGVEAGQQASTSKDRPVGFASHELSDAPSKPHTSPCAKQTLTLAEDKTASKLHYTTPRRHSLRGNQKQTCASPQSRAKYDSGNIAPCIRSESQSASARGGGGPTIEGNATETEAERNMSKKAQFLCQGFAQKLRASMNQRRQSIGTGCSAALAPALDEPMCNTGAYSTIGASEGQNEHMAPVQPARSYSRQATCPRRHSAQR